MPDTSYRPRIGEALAVRKLLHDGQPSYTWEGSVVHCAEDFFVLEALFTRGPRDLGYVVLEPNDLFVEFYYFDRWFNIFQIFAEGGALKGWYCNIGRPPQLQPGELRYVDLALDLFVYPDGRDLVLDEDEFEELSQAALGPQDIEGARQGLVQLQSWARTGKLPSRDAIRRG
jgi:protein associated with RNAse G/E